MITTEATDVLRAMLYDVRCKSKPRLDVLSQFEIVAIDTAITALEHKPIIDELVDAVCAYERDSWMGKPQNKQRILKAVAAAKGAGYGTKQNAD